jgi:predicted methyltransferase
MKCILSLLILVTGNLFSFAQNPWKDVYKESAWAQRDSWQRPEDIITLLKIKPGSRVADIGCHEGYFTVKLSGVVGDPGRVYAVDIDNDKLQKLKNHLETRKIKNVSVIRGEEDNPRLPTAALDAALIVDTYHEMDAHDEILRRIKAALKPGGRLVICEPISEERQGMSRADQEKKHELGLGYAVDDLKKAGFRIVEQQETFVDRTKEKGDRMWILVAEKSN